MKKYFKFFLTLITCVYILNMIAPISMADEMTITSTSGVKVTVQTASIFEKSLTQMLLDVGDNFNRLMNSLIGSEVTIDKLIFNKVPAVNANFFEPTTTANEAGNVVRDSINKWYALFRNIAVLVYVIAFGVVTVKMILEGTALSKAKGKETLMKWGYGVIILFLFPYVMKYGYKINTMILEQIGNNYSGNLGIVAGGEETFSDVEVEFRSPVYISKYTNTSSQGLTSKNSLYFNRIEEYKASSDVMRIMRAYAGVTGRFLYMVLWFMMLIQTIVMLIVYYKRFLIIAVLIVIFPIVSIFFVVDTLMGRNSSVFSTWNKEFFINVFTQSIHAITYAIITGIVMSNINSDITKGTTTNWILLVVAINFLFKGEAIIRKILTAGSDTSKSISEEAEASKKGAKGIGGNMRKLKG